jgi:hypothetical protein
MNMQADNAMIGGMGRGTARGEDGHGRMPRACVEAGLASDFWPLVRSGSIDTDLFK